MKKYFIASLLFFFFTQTSSQNIITDTLFVEFKPDTLIPFNLSISQIKDNRKGSPKLISYSKTKKFILVPVDQELSTKTPLYQGIGNSFNYDSTRRINYNLEIDYFLIEKYNGKIFNYYVLRADIPIYNNSEEQNQFIGTLSYNLEYNPPSRKTPKIETCETLLSQWHRQFKLDLLGVNQYLGNSDEVPERLITKKLSSSNFLNINAGSVIGLDFWQIEGEIYFSRPETTQKRWLLAHIIRYQNNPDLEMIGYGKKSEHFNKRLNQNWLLDISSNFLLGLNKWKVTEGKTLYHLVNLSLSSNQSINFDKINSSSWLVKAGLFENFYYIIGMKPQLQIGLYLSVGYKF